VFSQLDKGARMSLFSYFKSAKATVNSYMTKENVNTALRIYNLMVAGLVLKDYIDHRGTS
jgi:hypothetical protein